MNSIKQIKFLPLIRQNSQSYSHIRIADKQNSSINQKKIPSYASIMTPQDIDNISSQLIKDPMNFDNVPNLLRFKSEFSYENIQKLISESKDIYNDSKLNYTSFENKLNEMSKFIFDSDRLSNQQQLAQQAAIFLNKNLQIEINQILLSNNTKLIQRWIPLIQIYQKSLDLANDYQINSIYMYKYLFKPALIPLQNFQQLIKQNNLICFTSFQTFVSQQTLAIQYISQKNQNNQNVKVIFILMTQNIQPKSLRIKQIDQEFVTQPLITYQIADIQQCQLSNNILYYEVLIQMIQQ
ncbi:hypothetical protein ABPG74_004729 [Tetrahymena malaccensis]